MNNYSTTAFSKKMTVFRSAKNWVRKFVATLILTFALAMIETNHNQTLRPRPPIVLHIEQVPKFSRHRVMKNHRGSRRVTKNIGA